MSQSQSIKILVAGDVEGKFSELFDRVSGVNKKNGPFQMLLCVGNFIPQDFKSDLIIPPAPVPTFILGATTPTQLEYFKSSGSELAENVTYLGKSGLYAESSGVRIAYLSGVEGSKSSDFEFDEQDIKNLQIRLQNETQFSGIDILLTSQWPADIARNTTAVPETIKSMKCSSLISQLAVVSKPRYHFCGMEGVHFERAPYRNHKVLAEVQQHVTRFIALAQVGNKSKKKWLYAFSIAPMKNMDKAELIKSPPDVTDCPYTSDILQRQKGQQPLGGGGSKDQFFYDMSSSFSHGQDNRGGKRRHDEAGGFKKRPKKPFQPAACWFCLASPEVEKHLVVSIGDSAYLTLAKGGLVDDHVLILPIGHFQSTIECPKEVADEIQKFKSALKKMFEAKGQGVIFFERNYKSPHLQIQVIPVDKSIIPTLKTTCLEFGEANEVELRDMPPNAQLFQMVKVGFPYFYLELPDEYETKLFVQIRKGFDLQFGRELVASQPILNLPDRIDWRNCKGSKEEETELTTKFRKEFEKFDFTLS